VQSARAGILARAGLSVRVGLSEDVVPSEVVGPFGVGKLSDDVGASGVVAQSFTGAGFLFTMALSGYVPL
jgi:hypothetical protein